MPFLRRDQIQSRIQKRISALEKGYRQNLGLIGSSGLGKTYLLTQAFQSLYGHTFYLPIYINASVLDFNHLIDRWLGAMLASLWWSEGQQPPSDFQSLKQQASLKIPKTVEKIRQFKKMIRREKANVWVKELFSLSRSLSEETGKPIVFMIDEFQCLETLPTSDPFSLLGKEIMVQTHTLYLVSSSRPIRAQEIFREKLSLLFGNFEILKFSPLRFEEIKPFLAHQAPKSSFSNHQLQFLIRMTDGNPFYLDRILDHIQEGEVSNQHLLESITKELDSSKGRIFSYFENRLQLCHRLSKEGAATIRALLAVSHGRRKVLAISTFVEKKIPDVKKILQKLCEEDILIKRGSFYLLEDPLFCFWLKEVYEPQNNCLIPIHLCQNGDLKGALKRELEKSELEDKVDITALVEKLFKEFRNDVLEVGGKKIQCPHFSEIAFKPTNGRVFPLLAKNPKVRWVCQIAKSPVGEEDVTLFLEELKRYRKKVQRRILITLDGIDQNAKLMAQEAQIQLWNLRHFNALLELYNLPKMILMPTKEPRDCYTPCHTGS